MAQLGLFDAPATRGTARKRDRQTAKDAAASMAGDVLRDQQRKVLDVVAACWEHGATAYEVATQLGLQQNVMAKRLGELGDLGLTQRRTGAIGGELIYEARPGGSGRRCDVWRITDAGRERVRGMVDVQVAGYL